MIKTTPSRKNEKKEFMEYNKYVGNYKLLPTI